MAKRVDNADRTEITRRRQTAINLRRNGATWQQVADQCGYSSRGHACQDITRGFHQEQERTGESLAELRAEENKKLDDLERVVWDVLADHHVIIQGGKIVVDLEEEPLTDHGPILQAVDRLLRIAHRRATLHGIDSPTKVEQTGKLTYEIVGVDMSRLTDP